MDFKVCAMYFSATGTTRKIVSGIAREISESNHERIPYQTLDFTLPEVRQEAVSFAPEDVVILGVPVIAGRVPNILLKYLNSITGNGALAIPVVVYGNRNYDDALIELQDILESNGFSVIAAGAFIGEHSFSKTLAQNRPDEKDMAIVSRFAKEIISKITNPDQRQMIVVKGNKPYRKYYMPQDKDGNPVDLRKVTPKTNGNCIDCKLCVDLCPMGSINYNNVSQFNGICIKCGACIKKCPTGAKYYDDANYLRHKQELEIDFVHRREPELFL